MSEISSQPESIEFNRFGEILSSALAQSIERQLGKTVIFGFKAPECNLSTEAYRGWNLFVSGDLTSDHLTIRFTNDRGIDTTISGTHAEIAEKITAAIDLPNTEQIINGIEQDVARRTAVYEAWKASQTSATTTAVENQLI